MTLVDFRELLETTKKTSTFFANLYSDIDLKKINTVHDFQNNVPLLSKKDLLEIQKDSNMNLTNLDNYSKGVLGKTTSGTTSAMSCFYRTQDEIEASAERFSIAAKEYFNLNNKDKVMIVSNSSMAFVFATQFMKAGCYVGIGDINNLKLTAEMIQVMRSNMIRATPPVALRLAQILYESGYYDIDKFLLAGSVLSQIVKEKLLSWFPKSKIILQYGMTETAISLYQRKEGFGTSEYRTFNRDFFYEFLEFDSDKLVEPGKIGELVITKLDTNNPLIRYRTGDIFQVKEKYEDGTYLIDMIGRKDDHFKIKGIVVFKEKIDNALMFVKDLIQGEYQLEIDEIEEDDLVKAKLILNIELLDKNIENLEKLKLKISNEFARNFKVSDAYSWEDGINMGLFAKVEVRFVDEIRGNKIKSIIDRRFLRNDKRD